jgi:tetratricopeptide (TPR) repeat protein
MRMNDVLRGAVVAMALPALGAFAFAADSGGGSGGSAANCKDGKVWDQTQSKCVDPKKSGLDLDTLYEAGRDYAKAGRYGEAITVLATVAHTGDPRVLNYLGYSHRMSGRVEVGLGYYEEALRVNPNYTLAREYMGEAYLQKGDLASAKAQLDEIAARAGTSSAEYVELGKRIAAFELNT